MSPDITGAEVVVMARKKATKTADAETLKTLYAALQASNAKHTECNGKTDDEEFEDVRENLQHEVCVLADDAGESIGPVFAKEQAIIALMHNIHTQAGLESCLGVLREMTEALMAYEEYNSSRAKRSA
jgi:hypothetical protein